MLEPHYDWESRGDESLPGFGSRIAVIGHPQSSLLWAWAAIAAIGLFDIVVADRIGFRFVELTKALAGVLLLCSIGIFYDYTRRSLKLADVGHYAALWVAFSIVGSVLTYLAASMDFPLRDNQLAAFDAALGFRWYPWFEFVHSSRLLTLVLQIAYASFLAQIVLSVMYFSLDGPRNRNDELLWTALIALLITTIGSAIVPAVGPYIPGHMPDWSQVLLIIRGSRTSTFRLDQMKGIITTPSYHTVMAILLIYVHRRPARSMLPFTILNLLMLVATPSEGHHYLVDMIAGAAVAAFSIVLYRMAARGRFAAAVSGKWRCEEIRRGTQAEAPPI